MLYDSLAFATFLGVVAGLYRLCPLNLRRWYLLAASYAFYCTWSVPFAFLLVAVTSVACGIAHWIDNAESEKKRRLWLSTGIVLLFLPLATFKYSGWFTGAVAWVAGGSDWLSALPAIKLLLPIGISYYTLKLVSYLIDVYLEQVQCAQFSTVAAYAAFFPQTLAGPIQRAEDFFTQFGKAKTAGVGMVGSGIRLMLFGLFKKLVVADRLGLIVDPVFARPEAFSGVVLAVASYLYVIQLYADFSGLTDVAIGAGRLFGIEAPQNFDAPFFAQSIPEFWRRWHMTLTSWLTDYVFMPLQIALRNLGRVGLATSLMVTMVGIGVWHGPNWGFVIFGFIHGCYLIASVLTSPVRERLYAATGWNSIHWVTGPIATFHLVVVAAIPFRANGLGEAWYIFQRIGGMLVNAAMHFGAGVTAGMGSQISQLHWRLEDTWIAAGAVVLMEAVHLFRRRSRFVDVVVSAPPWARLAACYALAVAILLWGQSESTQFIYAQF
jgi:alginate O-acetyltransferase complex protein AlgI